jgi:hypothetical protein
MIKHVGKHNNKRVVVLFKTVPGEDHMCLVLYPEVLPKHIHDDVMKALESEAGQQAKEFSDYLFRYTLSDGNNALETLHKEGMIKKVPTNQVIITPNAKSTVRLDELNGILLKLDQGEEAIKELAELDAAAGLSGKRRVRERDLGEVRAPKESRSQPAEVNTSVNMSDVLSDEDLAKQRLVQAKRMQDEAKALLAEAQRLEKEANDLGGVVKENAIKSKKSKVKET